MYHKNNKTDKVYQSQPLNRTLNTKNLYNLFFQGHNPEDLRTMHHFGYCAKDDAEHCQIMRDHRRDSKYAKMGTWPQHYFRNTGVVNLHLVQGTVIYQGSKILASLMYVHPIFLFFVFWYFGHFSCVIFFPVFSILAILPCKM